MNRELGCIVDLETGGTKPGAAIFSIGAVLVDLNTSDVTQFFYKRIDIDSACKHGLLELSTMNWWAEQSASARAEALGDEQPDRMDFYDALEEFAQWYKLSGSETIWGNGATFDISLIEHFLLKFEIPIPWNFWDVRDVRTMIHLVGRDLRDQVPFDGIPHHALHDAAHEAKYTSLMWQRARAGLEIINANENGSPSGV